MDIGGWAGTDGFGDIGMGNDFGAFVGTDSFGGWGGLPGLVGTSSGYGVNQGVPGSFFGGADSPGLGWGSMGADPLGNGDISGFAGTGTFNGPGPGVGIGPANSNGDPSGFNGPAGTVGGAGGFAGVGVPGRAGGRSLPDMSSTADWRARTLMGQLRSFAPPKAVQKATHSHRADMNNDGKFNRADKSLFPQWTRRTDMTRYNGFMYGTPEFHGNREARGEARKHAKTAQDRGIGRGGSGLVGLLRQRPR